VYQWKDYWANVARSYGSADAQGFAPVLHPDAPAWFNSTIDRLQEKSWRRGLSRCELKDHALVLDIGCGTGRWLRRYLQLQHRPVGLDATQDMLRRASIVGLKCPVVAARAQKLPFLDGAFDLVSDVTVVQHISSLEQIGVLKEMARVLRPGGHLLLIELIKGQAPHIFPRSPKDWIEVASAAGLKPIYREGQEFLLFDQAVVQVVHAMRRLAGRKEGNSLPPQESAPVAQGNSKSSGRALYWAMRRIACKVSEWAEPLARRTCPDSWATHALFVFQKPA
jgi:ubiquinone/menaquinone biosynthesis C-methylase UbiE